MRSAKLLTAFGALLVASTAHGQGFNGGIPFGWTCVGVCGTAGASGAITLSGVSGSTAYGYVVTDGQGNAPGGGDFDAPSASGPGGGGAIGVSGETNGSRLTSTPFLATAGDILNFQFNYLTQDGTGSFTDHAWAALIGGGTSYLFTARTTPSGSASPGWGMPANTALLTPPTAPIISGVGSTLWGALPSGGGGCFGGFGAGCGHTGWIASAYTVTTTGSYQLVFGTSNVGDLAVPSGLAFDVGITTGGEVILETTTPEPGTWALMATGLAGLIGVGRRRKTA